ncbi:MAG: gamma-glutamyltransferase [Phycisphaerae bacterium]|nr:gamma-glutamyltransferase [Phycisphaerae bacterium]
MVLGVPQRPNRFTKHHVLLTAVACLAVCVSGLACAQSDAPAVVVQARNDVVVSVCDHASRVGVDVLKGGGNAVDAAVAVAFALAVTYPPAGNIGGGGFMLIYPGDGRKPVCIDYRETAPAGATEDMFASGTSRTDAKMVGVPGTIRGLELARSKYGSFAWKELVRPAIELAEGGFLISAALAESLNDVLERYPQMAELQRVYSPPEGHKRWAAGDRLIQKDLARTLRCIAQTGPDTFYGGAIADQIATEMKADGGLIAQADLAAYRAKLRQPVRGTYRGHDVFVPPPPSSGGIALIQMLNMLEPYELRRQDRWSAATLHLLIECMRRAYRDRAAYLGDPDFVEVPRHLTTKSYARELARTIDSTRATPSEDLAGPIPLLAEGDSTTHFSVIDKNGMAVANTYTLEQSYGSKIVVRGAGFLLNNEMGDFNRRPGVTDEEGRIGTKPNLIAPGKRMLSSQTPTIVARDGKVVLITGSPGGRTIINTVLCVVLNVLEFDLDPRATVDAPRLHHQWFPDEVKLEASAEPVSPGTIETLRAMGHTISRQDSDGSSYVQGDAHTIFVREGIYYGVADKRIHGGAAWY